MYLLSAPEHCERPKGDGREDLKRFGGSNGKEMISMAKHLRRENEMKSRKMRGMRRIAAAVVAFALFLAMQGTAARAETVIRTDEADSAKAADAENRTPTNPVHHCTKRDDGSDKTDFSYVYFGNYPQTEVMGSTLTEAITGASYDANGDAWVNGTKYRRISKSDTNYDGYFGDSAYRYFRWEQIKWRVLENDGSALFVMADKGLDCKNYHDLGDSITWEGCTIRKWLNNDFYKMALNSGEQEAVVERTIVNDDNPKYGTEGGNDTEDKVYLLSISEATNPAYGFCEGHSVDSVSRRVKASDYAHARGSIIDTSTGYEGNCWWGLRSPGDYTFTAAVVTSYHGIPGYGTEVSVANYACVPVLHISLSSDLWTPAEGPASPNPDEGDSPSDGDTVKPPVPQPSDGAPSGVTGTDGGNAQTDAPKATALQGKIKSRKKGVQIKWKKQPDAAGYQIQIAGNKAFPKKGTITKTVKKPSVTKLTVGKLKPGRKYYIRIRTYQTVNGKTVYSAWSKAKSAVTGK